jgi:hypothetical protein
MPATADFVASQRAAQGMFFSRNFPEIAGFAGARYRLHPEHMAMNLAPCIRALAPAYFGRAPPDRIAWHQHANHALSSQVCCLNFLMPLATRPELLSQVIGGALGIEPPTMLEVEAGPAGEPWFVGFEWIGREDYLNEAGKTGTRARGANATSADAVVRFERDGRSETLLIEWKYTEAYGAPIPPSGNATRIARYKNLAFAPDGPVKATPGLALEAFFFEPFYQLLRQQMLAWRMQLAHEDGAERVSVLHISPAGNRALHKVTSPDLRRFGDDAFAVFKSLLVRPDDFVSRTTEQVFAPALADPGPGAAEWAAYLSDRYTFLKTTRSAEA